MTDQTPPAPAVTTIETTPAAQPAAAPTPISLLSGKDFLWGTGRRKTSVARVRIRSGNGAVLVNGRPFEEFFPVLQHRVDSLSPADRTGSKSRYDIFASIKGGGPTGQAGALRLGLARALVKAEPDLEEALREAGDLTRDSRMVERKKYGQRKARRRYQFSKR